MIGLYRIYRSEGVFYHTFFLENGRSEPGYIPVNHLFRQSRKFLP